MSDAEIGAAWLKTKREYRAIEEELAGLKSELTRFGESLIAAGKIFKDNPSMAWNQDSQSLADAVLTAGKQAERYNDLLTEAVTKKAQLDEFEKSAD